MRLLAVSDLHLDHRENRAALRALPACPNDWLVIAGDVGHRVDHLAHCLDVVIPRFARVIWTPGNHDLWSLPDRADDTRGVARYEQLVALARSYGAVTPEDPFPVFDHPSGPVLIAPVFVLYDYSFRPPTVPPEGVVAWAAAAGCVCVDEYLLHPDPYATRTQWCHARCAATERRLATRPDALPTVLISHFPLEEALAVLPLAPRFTPWCGTQRTRGWHRRFDARAVVFGHLHIPGMRWLDGVPFHEVSFGYPGQRRRRGVTDISLHDVQLAPKPADTAETATAGPG